VKLAALLIGDIGAFTRISTFVGTPRSAATTGAVCLAALLELFELRAVREFLAFRLFLELREFLAFLEFRLLRAEDFFALLPFFAAGAFDFVAAGFFAAAFFFWANDSPTKEGNTRVRTPTTTINLNACRDRIAPKRFFIKLLLLRKKLRRSQPSMFLSVRALRWRPESLARLIALPLNLSE
jgi:hypothetical protein